MNDLPMPKEREFGWPLKPVSSSYFGIDRKENGQFCAVLNHALLRGVSAEMIHWWFLNFAKLKVRLRDVPGYEDQRVPAYWLWHPVDHVSARLVGRLGPGGTAVPGCSIHICEVMQYDRYGWKYPVDATLKVFYVGPDGWAMGKVLPIIGPVMMLRIHFKDVFCDGQHAGVHYHYEVVIGASGNNLVSRTINNRVTREYGSEFFAAWQRHNVIEVGTFENFLPALFAQKNDLANLEYAREMTPENSGSEAQKGFDHALFENRLAAYSETARPHDVQCYAAPSFL